ncbi:DUF6653 family protein [Synechococcus elongatus]|uniref:DUF6653 family protein n=1 Tax=Synechococcus elongatus TaxID=32046 RepID=UPI003CC8CA85
MERRITSAFHMDEDTWAHHANPWSIWTHFAALSVLILTIWSRVWWDVDKFPHFCKTSIDPSLGIQRGIGRASLVGLSYCSCALTPPIDSQCAEPEAIRMAVVIRGLVTLNGCCTLLGCALIYLVKLLFTDRKISIY